MLGKYEDEYYRQVVDDIEASSQSMAIVFDIIHNMSARRGLGNQFEQIDDDIQEEIVESWTLLIENRL